MIDILHSGHPSNGDVSNPRDHQPEQQSGAYNVEPSVIPSQTSDPAPSGVDSADRLHGQESRGEFENSRHGQGQHHATEKPGFGQRMKGNLEKMTGKAMRDPGMVEEGTQLKTGQSGCNF